MAHAYGLPLPDSESGTDSSTLTIVTIPSPPTHTACPTSQFKCVICNSLFPTEPVIVQHVMNSGHRMLCKGNREAVSFLRSLGLGPPSPRRTPWPLNPTSLVANTEGTATHDPFGGREDMTIDLLSKLEGGNDDFITSTFGPKVELDLELKL